MEVYKSKYRHIDFFPEQKLIEEIWLPTTNKMTDEEYKQEFLNYGEIVLEVRPKKLLADLRNMFFVISPELQEWTNQTIFPSFFEVGLNNIAFIAAQQILTQVAVEQTLEESEGRKFNTRYFSNREEAKEWILSL